MKNYWLSKLRLWEVDDGEQHWYSAESREDAFWLHCEPFCDTAGRLRDEYLPCPRDEIEITEVSPNTILPVRMIDEGDEVVKKTAAEWAAEGAGLVASTVY